ncbi:hypothetical protein AGLY_004198 [Aphis glycines]|uniref:Uncharacterized protein n=1 Tax=Aphis glycines TaxID=307491 RepID=A0A6G0TZQ7_APHGL|nr:hypothetical protein AGLY_004198 [Aphis glycines]
MVHWKQYTSIIRSSFEVLKAFAKSESLMNTFKRPMTFITQLWSYKYPRNLIIIIHDIFTLNEIHIRYCHLPFWQLMNFSFVKRGCFNPNETIFRLFLVIQLQTSYSEIILAARSGVVWGYPAKCLSTTPLFPHQFLLRSYWPSRDFLVQYGNQEKRLMSLSYLQNGSERVRKLIPSKNKYLGTWAMDIMIDMDSLLLNTYSICMAIKCIKQNKQIVQPNNKVLIVKKGVTETIVNNKSLLLTSLPFLCPYRDCNRNSRISMFRWPEYKYMIKYSLHGIFKTQLWIIFIRREIFKAGYLPKKKNYFYSLGILIFNVIQQFLKLNNTVSRKLLASGEWPLKYKTLSRQSTQYNYYINALLPCSRYRHGAVRCMEATMMAHSLEQHQLRE